MKKSRAQIFWKSFNKMKKGSKKSVSPVRMPKGENVPAKEENIPAHEVDEDGDIIEVPGMFGFRGETKDDVEREEIKKIIKEKPKHDEDDDSNEEREDEKEHGGNYDDEGASPDSSDTTTDEDSNEEKNDDSDIEEIEVEVPVGKRGRRRASAKFITVLEKGDEIEVVKVKMPKFSELKVFDAGIIADLGMPEFWPKKLQKVPYARQVRKTKIVPSELTIIRKKRRGVEYPVTAKQKLKHRRKKDKELKLDVTRAELRSPVMVAALSPIYEELSPGEIQRREDNYRKKYAEQWGGRPEDVVVPLSPRKVIGYRAGKQVKKSKRGPSKLSPVEEARPAKDYSIANPHNKKYPTGKRVQFRANKTLHKGLVKSFTKFGITVMSNRKEYKIKYSNPTLKTIKKSKEAVGREKDYMKFKSPPTHASIYNGPVPDSLRTRVIKVYVELLKEIKSVGSSSPQPKTDGFSMVPPKSWDEYYEEQFIMWRYQTYGPVIAANLNYEAIANEVEEQNKQEKDLQRLLGIVNGNLERNIDEYTVSSDILRGFNSKSHLSVFESRFIECFRQSVNAALPADSPGILTRTGTGIKHIQPQRKDIKGLELAEIIGKCIENYIITNPDIEQQVLIDRAIQHGLESYDQVALKAEFDEKHLDALQNIFIEYAEQYQRDYAAYQEHLRKIQETKTFEAAKITNVENEVKEYEEIIYNNHGKGKTVYSYLRKVLTPYLFMYGPLAAHAKFFRAKLANGMFQFKALAGANLAHYFPEFIMGIHEDKEVELDDLFGLEDAKQALWKLLGETIMALTSINIESFIDSYGGIMNPTRKKDYKMLIQKASNYAGPLTKILVTPSVACQNQTGTGRRPVVKDGKYVYRIVGTGKNKHREQIFEDIPNGDLMICFSNNKFSCHSIEELRVALAKNPKHPINIQTGKPYPKDFIQKFKDRHYITKNVTIPSDEDLEADFPKTPIKSPSKVRSSVKKAIPKRHKRVKGRETKEVSGILLLGDEINHMAGYMETVDIPIKEGTLSVYITNDAEEEKFSPNAAIISFDGTAKNGPDLDLLEGLIDSVPDNMDIYIFGVGFPSAKNKAIYNARIKDLSNGDRVERIFYVENEEENVINGIIDVVIDVEGIQVDDDTDEDDDTEAGFIPYYTPTKGWRTKKSPARKTSTKKPRIKSLPPSEKTSASGKPKSGYKVIEDVFDPETNEYALMEKYFSGPELLIRTANLIMYKNYIFKQSGQKGIDELEQQIKSSKSPKKFLTDITDTFEYKELLKKWYNHFAKELNTKKHIDDILIRYTDAENVLFNRLYIKYVDPDWDERAPLWFAELKRKFEGDVKKLKRSFSPAKKTKK